MCLSVENSLKYHHLHSVGKWKVSSIDTSIHILESISSWYFDIDWVTVTDDDIYEYCLF